MFNPTVARITLRATLGRRRALLFALPPLVLILFTLALKSTRPPSRPWPSVVLGTFGFTVLLPLTALIIGTSVLGAEIDDGSIVHLLATPVRRVSIVLTKFSVATVLTMAFAAVPELIAALISGGGSTPNTTTVKAVSGGQTVFFSPGTPISDSKFALGLFGDASSLLGCCSAGWSGRSSTTRSSSWCRSRPPERSPSGCCTC